MNYSPITMAAIEAAHLAGAILKKHFGSPHTIQEKEGAQNLVTECDLLSEQTIVSFLQKKFPTHGFLAEENTQKNLEADTLWIIDPLDGTVNFAKNIPHFSISIAAYQKGSILCGVILHPILGELFVAEKEKGAFLQGKKLSISSTKNLSQSFLASGFPYNVQENPLHCIDVFSSFVKMGIPIRRIGSAALDLAYTAAGRFDGYFETNLKPWDVAAGILLVQEAGGCVSTWQGNPHPILEASSILATSKSLYEPMLHIIQKG